MLTNNPFAEVSAFISPLIMQGFVVLMVIFVIGGTLFDVIHKKSARYFFDNMNSEKNKGLRALGGGEKIGIAVKTLVHDVAVSGEFCSMRRRIAHLLTMYGFIAFLVATAVMVFAYSGASTPSVYPLLWHVGAFMVCIGGYGFWFFIRADVAAEGNSPFRLIRADLFVLSLLATCTFALIWSFVQGDQASALSNVFLVLFLLAALVLFAGVPWSKFAHMFFKPAAALQKHLAEADGSRSNLPEPADAPAQFGLGIKRDVPRHY